jgi:hypothetical protein
MPLYRRKPTTVDAEQFTRDHTPRGVQNEKFIDGETGPFVVTMQKQRVPVSYGEWIVKEASGDGYYPIADEEFQRIYELEK